MNAEHWMKLAIAQARQGIGAGQTPFGAVIVRGDELLVEAHNTVRCDFDSTAHAEVNAIRAATAKLQTIELDGYTMFSSCEPCPMCLAAIHWARIDRVVYGASIEDAAEAGFSELRVGAADLARQGGSQLVVEQGPLQDECAALFQEWAKCTPHDPY